MNNKLIFLMGVSGAGKATMRGFLKDFPMIQPVCSYCTRPMRPGEVDGDIYHFISEDEFKESLERGEFFEYAFQRGEYYYGTKYKDIEYAFATGKMPIKELDMIGLIKMKNEGTLEGMYVTIFLDIPNDEMIRRITKRESLDEVAIQKRLDKADEERKTINLCDYVIDADRSVEEVKMSVIKTLGLE